MSWDLMFSIVALIDKGKRQNGKNKMGINCWAIEQFVDH